MFSWCKCISKIFYLKKEEFDTYTSIKEILQVKSQLIAMIIKPERNYFNDEGNISIPSTLKLNKYQEDANWYQNN